MVIKIERVRVVNGEIVRTKSYLPSGYSGMTRKQQDKSLKEQLGKNKKSKKKPKKKSKKKKMLKKPKAKLPSIDPKKFISSTIRNQTLVSEGKIGHFNEEYMEEKIKWLR